MKHKRIWRFKRFEQEVTEGTEVRMREREKRERERWAGGESGERINLGTADYRPRMVGGSGGCGGSEGDDGNDRNDGNEGHEK